MNRLALAAVCAALLPAVACASFKDLRTPSGDFCSDMPIVPAGQEPDREYHRLQPITSDTKARTEAERLESLRKVACKAGADAVIEAVNEEVRGDNAQYQMVSSGTAVIWLHRAGAAEHGGKLLSVTTTKKPADPPPPPAEPPPPAPSAEPTAAPAKSATPAAGKPAKPGKRPIAPPPAPKN
jgi:hypothetical protein